MAATNPIHPPGGRESVIRELAEDLREAAAEGAAFEAACIAGMLVGLGAKVSIKGESEQLWKSARDELSELQVTWLERMPAAIRLGPEVQLALFIDIDELCAGFAWLGYTPPALRAELDLVVETVRDHRADFAGLRRVAHQHVRTYLEAGLRTPSLALWSAVIEGDGSPAEG